MKYLLDTNICIYIIKKAPQKVFEKFQFLQAGDVGISAITFAELQYGVSASRQISKNQVALDAFLAPIQVLDFPSGAAILYGEKRADLKKKGRPIGNLDLLIGVHALYLGVTLITNNIKEFSKILDLKIENWT